jgi:hypothetical protein
MHRIFYTQHKYSKHIVKKHRPKVRDTDFSPGSVPVPVPGRSYQHETQPIQNLMTDQNQQIQAEESFFTSQLESGRLAEANNMVEQACDYVNRYIFNEAAQWEVDAINAYEADQQMQDQQMQDQRQQQQQQQQQEKPMPHPAMVGLGGY